MKGENWQSAERRSFHWKKCVLCLPEMQTVKRPEGFPCKDSVCWSCPDRSSPGQLLLYLLGEWILVKYFQKNSPEGAGARLVQTEGSIHSSKGTLIHFSSKAVFSCKTQEVFYFCLLGLTNKECRQMSVRKACRIQVCIYECYRMERAPAHYGSKSAEFW